MTWKLLTRPTHVAGALAIQQIRLARRNSLRGGADETAEVDALDNGPRVRRPVLIVDWADGEADVGRRRVPRNVHRSEITVEDVRVPPQRPRRRGPRGEDPLAHDAWHGAVASGLNSGSNRGARAPKDIDGRTRDCTSSGAPAHRADPGRPVPRLGLDDSSDRAVDIGVEQRRGSALLPKPEVWWRRRDLDLCAMYVDDLERVGRLAVGPRRVPVELFGVDDGRAGSGRRLLGHGPDTRVASGCSVCGPATRRAVSLTTDRRTDGTI